MNKQNGRSNDTTSNSTAPKAGRLSTIRNRVAAANTTEYCLCDAKTILLAISTIQAVGGAIVFGNTRDGGALVVTVLVGNENEKFYCKDAHELVDTLTDIVVAFDGDILPEVRQHIRDCVGK